MKSILLSVKKRISSGDRQNTQNSKTSANESSGALSGCFPSSSSSVSSSNAKSNQSNDASKIMPPVVSASTNANASSTGTGREWQAQATNRDVSPPAFNKAQEGNNPFAELQSLEESPQSERQALFSKKMSACSIVYDFRRTTMEQQKEDKRKTLFELVEYVNNSRNAFNEHTVAEVITMVSNNIFRALPASSVKVVFFYDADDDEPVLDVAWYHLQVIYEFLLRLIVCTDVDVKVLRRGIDCPFVLKLLELYNSEDPRERDYLKTILHRIYGRIMALRSFIRKSIQNVFYKFLYEGEHHNGISELLEILGSIINGFALPLKEEHQLFLCNSIIPLHKSRTLTAFHSQLSYCITQFVEKDCRLVEAIIIGLLRYWPITNTPKEVLFLNELEEILELTKPEEFQRIMEALFRRLAECIQSPHFQVAERVLFLWNNEYIVSLINSNRNVLFPIIMAALFRNSKVHWNQTVHGLTFNVIKLLAEADPYLFEACSDRQLEEENYAKTLYDERKKRWKDLIDRPNEEN